MVRLLVIRITHKLENREIVILPKFSTVARKMTEKLSTFEFISVLYHREFVLRTSFLNCSNLHSYKSSENFFFKTHFIQFSFFDILFQLAVKVMIT